MINQSYIRQNRGVLNLLILCVCMCAIPLQGVAQDAVLENGSEEHKYVAENPGFNAVDSFSLQPRFRYGDSEPYLNKKFYDNTSIGMVWHVDKIHERIEHGFVPALNYGVFIEKEINKLHSLRLLVYEGIYQQASRSLRMNKYQAELLYSFNWTRYFGGYNPYRKVEAVTSLGVGGFYSKRLEKVEKGPMAIVGAGARMLLSPAVSLSIEPYVALASDNVDFSGIENFRKYDVLYGTDVSLAYTFHSQEFRDSLRQKSGYKGRAFMDFGIGAQFEPFLGYYRRPNDVPFFASAGPHIKLGVGYWLRPGLAIRATGNLSTSSMDADDEKESDVRLKNVLANGRLDFLFSPYHYIKGNDDLLFDVYAVLGWEYGQTIKTAIDPAKLLRTHYDGFSAGLQLRYKYDEKTSLYVEPRVTLANYNVPYAAPYQDYVDHYRDYLYSLTAGLEYSVTENGFKGRKKQPSPHAPHISLSMLGGVNYLFITKEHASDFSMDYSGGLAGDMQITPYSGIRLMADYSRLSFRDAARVTGRYGFVDVSADYVFNLGTLLQGYDINKKWDVALAAGPVLSRRVGEKFITDEGRIEEYNGKAIDQDLGFQVGIPVGYRIAPRWDILFEPRARFFGKDYINQVHSQGASKILNAQLGLRYSFQDRYYEGTDTLFKAQPGHLFTHLGVGAQSAMTLGNMGPRIEAGLGYWFNPGLATRASINLMSHDWKPGFEDPLNDYRQVSASGRLDLMLAPFDYVANRYDRLFGLNFILGWEYGRMLRGNRTDILDNYYNALSGGLQLRYNYDGYRAFYLEPRYTYNLSTESSYYSLVAGMELGATEYAFHSNKYQPGEFRPAFSFAVLGGLGYIYNGKEYVDAPISDYTGGIAAEYKFSPYSAVRFTGSYANYHQRELYSGNDGAASLHNYSVDYMNFGLDYVFDVTTLMQGYTNDRRWNAALAIGPTLGYKVAESEKVLREGYVPFGEPYSESASNFFWGAQVAAPVSYDIDNNWAIMFEPRVKTSFEHLFNKRTKYPFLQYDALLGVKYTPDEELYNHLSELNQSHRSRYDFVNYAIGLQYAAGTGIDFGQTGGVQLGLGLGRWFNSLLGIRLGAEIAASHLNSVELNGNDLLLKSARIGGRVDMMLNPLAFGSNYTPGRLGTALLLGWEAGGKIDALYYTSPYRHFYNSLSVAAQLRLRTDENHAFYIEPRYAIDDRLVSMTAGLEYAMSEYRFRSGRRQPGEFTPYYSIGLAGGVSHRFLTNMYAGMPQLGVNAGLSGEYHFTPYSGVRFTAGYAEVTTGTTKRTGHINTGFDYMFDLSTLFAGYTLERRLGVALAAGPVFSTRASESKEVAQLAESSVGAQVGIPVQYRLNENLGITLEPRAQAFFNRDYALVNGGRSAIVNLLMGVNYTPGEKLYEHMEKLNLSHNSRYDFINYAVGLQYATGMGVDFGHTGGMQLGLGVGRWVNSLLGVRLGAELAASHLNSVNLNGGELLLKSARFGGRVEMMVNPLAFSRSYTPGRFGTALLLGWEAGGKIDALYYTRPDKHFYNSLSVAAQLRLRTDENHTFYIEPRYALDDHLVSMTAGLEYAMSEHRFRSSRRQPGEFKPYYNIGVVGGVSHRFLTNVYAGLPQLGVSAGVSGEYHFTPYSGARFAVEYAEVTNGTAVRVGHINNGFDYMFDLSTLFAGYTPDRCLDVALAAGPVFSTRTSEGNVVVDHLAKSSIGMQVGIPVQYRFNENFGVSLEPRAQAFFNRDYAALNGGRSAIMNLQAGVKYTPGERFYQRMEMQDETYGTRRSFVNYSMGLQYAAGNGIAFGSTGGMQLGLGVGRWFNSLLGARVGAEIAASNLNSVNLQGGELLLKSARIGGRVDVMLNPLAFGSSYTPGRFGTALLLGWEAGGKIDALYYNVDRHFYSSMSVGAQLRLRTDEEHILYIEPRYALDDHLVSVSAGMEFGMSEYRFRASRRQPGEFKPYYNVGVAAGLSHRFLTNMYAGLPQLGINTSLSGEYHFTPYSGARLSAGYAEVTNGTKSRVGHVDMGVDYMFDLSTLFAGYTPDRRLNVTLAAGPLFSMKASKVNHIAKMSVGTQVGIPVQYRLNENWGISLEPRAKAFFNRDYAALNGGRSAIMNLLVGATYSF